MDGGEAIVNNDDTFNLPYGTPQQIANEVIRILDKRTGMRRQALG